jgi:3-phenylpropionate/trans-cinnamate dioxygenase ferredoxin reductase component
MRKSKYVILGGGMVAGYAAKELVERGLKPGELTIVSADNALPYERPPLSKSFLAGKDSENDIRINSPDFYRDHEVAVKLDCPAAGLDAAGKTLQLRGAEPLGFDQLVVATGARVRRLNIAGADLAGVYYLRSLEDSKSIRTHAASARRALVVGGSFIAMEVAAVLAQKGVSTTMLVREDRVWKRFFTPAMSRFFESYYTARGVEFQKEVRLGALHGAGAVESASLDGGRTLECDLVVAGVGVLPVTEPVAGSGIEIRDGLVVNEYLETNQPGIYAAGDVANFQDPLSVKQRRVEHWDNAVSQGRHCARALLGERAPFRHVPYFFSDVFDLSYEFWGDTAGADEAVERGDPSSTSFSVWWLKRQRLVAAFVMNRPDEEREAAPRWIESGQPLSAADVRGSGLFTKAGS